MDLREHQPLAEYTRLGIGGATRYMVDVASVDDCRSALELVRVKSLAWSVLGAGTATVVADQGFDGCVIRTLGSDREYLPGGSFIFCGERLGEMGSVGAIAMHGGWTNELKEYHWLDPNGGVHVLQAEQWQQSGLQHSPGLLIGIVPKVDVRVTDLSPIPPPPSSQVFLPHDGGAAAAISEVGWAGKELGKVRLWDQDPTWLIPQPRARAEEVVQLMSLVKQQVRDTLGIQLRDAISYLGM